MYDRHDRPDPHAALTETVEVVRTFAACLLLELAAHLDAAADSVYLTGQRIATSPAAARALARAACMARHPAGKGLAA